MRITIQIDANDLANIQRLTGQKKKSPAVEKVLSDYLRQQRRERLIARALSGESDFSLTNKQLEARDIYETR
jgi:Arc/MetJ family transcription regulator